jgi:D-3-phosphoglycerate dehydrogenase / 2-oxoglutarate reductase
MENIFPIILIDFDSTFVKIEALERLAEIVLSATPNNQIILEKIRRITELGMTGKISFDHSLEQRFGLLNIQNKYIDELVLHLRRHITQSFIENREFIRKNKNSIYVISGGFIEWIWPICKDFGLNKDHVIANKFLYEQNGEIIGYDKSNSLAQAGGKARTVKSLNLTGKVYVIGDGYTDFEIKEKGYADKFFLFVENVKRDQLIDKADVVLENLDDFIEIY